MFTKLADEVSNISYYCSLNHCDIKSAEILKQLGPIREKVEENSQRISVLEGKVRKNSEEMEAKVKEEIETNVAETIEEKVKNAWETEKDRAVRAKNVLLANVPESEAGQGEERKKDDENMVNALFTNALKIDANDTRGKIVSVGRLGKKEGDNANRAPRVMKVVLDQKSTAQRVFRAAPKLRENNDDEIGKIKIFRDLNQEDRNRRKILVDEVKHKNEELRRENVTDSKWIIRGDKTVKVKVNPNRPRNKNF